MAESLFLTIQPMPAAFTVIESHTVPNAKKSEKRQKQHRITLRVSAQEHAEITHHAELAGLTVGAYIRSQCLIQQTTRAIRRPTIEVITMTRLQGEMNRVGSNIHQLLKHINFGNTPDNSEIKAAFKGYQEVIQAILAALGRQPK